jgi:hypothetical protein
MFKLGRMNAHRHPCLEWDSNPMIPVFERAKTIHDLDRAATVRSAALIYVDCEIQTLSPQMSLVVPHVAPHAVPHAVPRVVYLWCIPYFTNSLQ